MAYPFVQPHRAFGQVQALLAANRLEARPRSPEFNRALRAEVRDPTWLLARQWQMHEFRAEDRGTPAAAAVRLRQQSLSCLATAAHPQGRPYDPAHQPLEAAVEASPRAVGLGLRLQMGQAWLRLVNQALSTLPATTDAAELTTRQQARQAWAHVYPLRPATGPVADAQLAADAEAQALVQLAGDQSLDGYALYQDLLVRYRPALTDTLADSVALEQALRACHPAQDLLADTRFPNTPYATHAGTLDRTSAPLQAAVPLLRALATSLDELARQFILMFHRLYFLGEAGDGWATESLAYAFSLGAGETGLAATHYPGGAALPWYTVDRASAPAATPAPAAASTLRTVLPTEILFPGAPVARWWEFEDRRVDFGQVTGHAADWGRMLLQEFMFLYQNDWFTVPYAVRPGSVCQVESLLVTDVFNQTYRLQPAGAGQLVEDAPGSAPALIDNDANRWRLFAQTDPAAGPALAPVLYVPATALHPLIGPPSEQVSFRREEATNLVWAVESIVPDGFTGGLSGGTAAARTGEALRRLASAQPTATPSASSPATYQYELMSSVPENWLPFVPSEDATGRQTLALGQLERQVPGYTFAVADRYVQPRTVLLQGDPTVPYLLHEHEVPPMGVRVDGRGYRARWYGGRTLHWFGRQRGPALAGGSSGLVFDQMRPLAT